MPEQFEVMGREVANHVGSLNLVDLSGLPATLERAKNAVFPTSEDPAKETYDFSKLAINSAYAASAGVLWEKPRAIEAALLNVNKNLGALAEIDLPAGAMKSQALQRIATIENNLKTQVGVRGVMKGVGTMVGVWALDKYIDHQYFSEDRFGVATVLADLAVTPALAFMPGPWLVKGALMVGSHVGGRYIDRALEK